MKHVKALSVILVLVLVSSVAVVVSYFDARNSTFTFVDTVKDKYISEGLLVDGYVVVLENNYICKVDGTVFREIDTQNVFDAIEVNQTYVFTGWKILGTTIVNAEQI